MLGWRLQAIMRKPATRRACAGINRRTNKAIKGGTHDGCGSGFFIHGRIIPSLLRCYLRDLVCRRVATQLHWQALASVGRLYLADYFRANNMSPSVATFPTAQEARTARTCTG